MGNPVETQCNFLFDGSLDDFKKFVDGDYSLPNICKKLSREGVPDDDIVGALKSNGITIDIKNGDPDYDSLNKDSEFYYPLTAFYSILGELKEIHPVKLEDALNV